MARSLASPPPGIKVKDSEKSPSIRSAIVSLGPRRRYIYGAHARRRNCKVRRIVFPRFARSMLFLILGNDTRRNVPMFFNYTYYSLLLSFSSFPSFTDIFPRIDSRNLTFTDLFNRSKAGKYPINYAQ